MKKINLKYSKHLYALSFLSAFFLMPEAQAQISFKAFKGVTRFFKKEKEYYSPTLGKAALDNGLIYNLRFMGNIEEGHDENNTRDWKQDKPLDAVSRLVKYFFPSPAGHLAPETSANDNLGKYIRDPKTVALLLNFANETRTYLETQQKLIVEEKEKFANLSISTELPEIRQRITYIKTVISKKKKEETSLKNTQGLNPEQKETGLQALKAEIEKLEQELKDKLVEQKNLGSELQKIKATIPEAEDKKKNEEHFQENKKIFFKNIKESLELKEENIGFDKTLISILNTIESSLKEEGIAFYPRHTTEQVITAFFCEKFNTQTDIWNLLKDLDDTIVDKTQPFPQGEDYLEKDDLSAIAAQPKYNLDDIFDLANSSLFHLITPYKPGSHLISNGSTYPFDRKNNTIDTTVTFADCAEIAARHVMNLLLFDMEEKKFNLSFLEEYIQRNAPNNPYFEKFKEFYMFQPPFFANNGEIGVRSTWNRVVGDLNNSEDPIQVKYVHKTYEVETGFINFVNIFRKVFGIKIEDLPQGADLEVKRAWLEKSLRSLFTAVNPHRVYEMNLSNFQETQGELSGTIPITVKDGTTKENLFSFEFYQKYGIHAEIKNLQILKTFQSPNYEDKIESHADILKGQSTDESLWLLTEKKGQGKIKSPLYALFSEALTDNDSRIRALTTLKETYGKTHKPPPFINAALKNILSEMSWEDEEVVENIMPLISGLALNKDFKDVLLQKVQGLALTPFFLKHFPYQVKEFINLKSLSLKDILDLKGISLTENSQLKWLKINNSKIEKLDGLENLKNLETLYLCRMSELQELSFKDNLHLKTLELITTHVKKIDGLENLKNLEMLWFGNNKNLKELSLKNHPKLTDIFGLLSFKKIDLENLPSLSIDEDEFLSSKNIMTEELSLKNLPKLKELDLGSPSLKKINLEELDHLNTLTLKGQNLQGLSLKNNSQLENFVSIKVDIEEFSLKDLPQLQNFAFINTKVKSLYIENLDGVEDLDLKRISGLEKIVFKGSFAKLKAISFENSNTLETIEGLKNLSNLETLNVKGTSKLRRSSLKTLPSTIKVIEDEI